MHEQRSKTTLEQDGHRRVHGLILSGGKSRRMGQPKALLTYGEGTFLSHLGDVLGQVCASVTVVVGAHHRQIQDRVPDGVSLVHAADWAMGMRASLRAGLSVLPPGPVLLTHVDRPSVSLDTVARLVGMSHREAIVPVYQHQPGHPVLIPDWLRRRLLMRDETPLRDLLHQAGYRRLEVLDRGVLENVNCPRDYARLRAPG